MQDEQINALIINFLTNDISEDEMKALYEWIQSAHSNANYFNECIESWMIAGYGHDEKSFDSLKSWEQLKSGMNQAEALKVRGKTRTLLIRYSKMAASWLVFFMLGFTTLYLVRRPAEIMPRPVVIEVPRGAKSSLVLPDGSKVWLNAGTRLTYDENYGRTTRSIHLSGEAYFDVEGDKKHPFIVNTSGLKIEALGTKFNVKAYPEEPSVMTTLEEGKIDIKITEGRAGAREIILMPNEKFVYRKSTGSYEKSLKNSGSQLAAKPVKKAPVGVIEKQVNTELYTSWKDKRWIIEGETLDNLAPILERKYNVKITFTDEVLKFYSFTGTIENETIEQIMQAIKLTAPIDFELHRDSVVLTADRTMQNQFKQITRPD